MAKTPDRFTSICPQCGSAVLVQAAQIGSPVTCPDCLEEFFPSRPEAVPDESVEIGETPGEITADDSANLFEGEWEETRRQLDSLLQFDAEPPAPAPPSEASRDEDVARDYEFTVACPLCGTRLGTSSDKIGTKLRCPDCHSSFVVREPPPSARRPRRAKPENESLDDELKLSEPHAQTPYSQLAGDFMDAAEKEITTPSVPPRRVLLPNEIIREQLKQAAEVEGEVERQQPTFPARPFSTRIFQFLWSPASAGRWGMLAIGLQLELAAIQSAATTAEGGPIEQVMGIFIRMFAAVFGFLFLSFASVSLLIIAQHSSRGEDVIEEMPGMNVIDWILEAWPMFASLFLVLAPGLALGQLAWQLTDNFRWFTKLSIGVGTIAMTFVFPVVLLSILENNWPYSRAVWRSLRDARGWWIGFWLRAGALVLATVGLGRLRYGSQSTLLNLVLAVVLVLLVMLYFRLLGRLAWACNEAIGAASEPENPV